jgi:hypothetical protein
MGCLLGVHAATLAELSTSRHVRTVLRAEREKKGLVDIDITSGVGDRNLFDLTTNAAAPLIAVRGSSSSMSSATAWPHACAAGGGRQRPRPQWAKWQNRLVVPREGDMRLRGLASPTHIAWTDALPSSCTSEAMFSTAPMSSTC